MRKEKYRILDCYSEEYSDIIFAEFQNTMKIDLTAAKEIVANRLDFAKDKKHYLIVDVSNVREVSTEAKEFLQRRDTGLKNILGAAFIATNPVSGLIANIFIKTQKDFQAKLFPTKQNAVEWIIAYRQKIG